VVARDNGTADQNARLLTCRCRSVSLQPLQPRVRQ
jgi:hypothetical protein